MVTSMDQHVSKSVFKARALEFLREVERSGKSLVVTDNGRPVVELRAFRSISSEPLDELRGSLLSYDRPFDPVAEDDWAALAEPDPA